MNTELMPEKQVMEVAGRHGFVKVNLPSSLDDYQRGNGEGVWAVIPDHDDMAKHKGDCAAGQFVAVICNDSCYYPHLKYGASVLCEFRGQNRAVACWDDLAGTKDAPGHKEDTWRKMGLG